MTRYPDGTVELDGDEMIVAQIFDCILAGDDISTFEAYSKMRALNMPLDQRPSTPMIDDVFRDTEFRDYLLHGL